MSRTRTVQVRDVCNLIVDCVNRTAPVVDEQTPFRMIRTTNIRNGRIDMSGCKYVDEATFEHWTRRAKVLDGDVLLTREAPIGEVGFVDNLGSVFLGQRLMQYRANPEVLEPRYLFYSFLSPKLQHQFKAHDGSGSVVSHIRVADCHEFSLELPPLPEQRAIAATLGALDDKIELNRKMNEALEAMARALFRDWFVDFGPTRAKMQGRPAYLSKDLWSLFPDRLDDEGKPEGWDLYKLEQIADYHTKTLTPAKMADMEVEHFSLPAFDKGQIPSIDHGTTIKSNKTLVPPLAVLLSKLNPEIPRVWMPESHRLLRQVASTEFLAFTAKDGAGRNLLYCLFSDQRFREMLHGVPRQRL